MLAKGNPLITFRGNCEKPTRVLFLNMETTYITTISKARIMRREHRFCLACEKQVIGRTDKKFCNEVCRNGFNNRLNAECNNLVRNINHALVKNRRILASYFSSQNKEVTTTANSLLQKGFQFKYFTHHHSNKKGTICYFCYDYGYLMLKNECLLIKSKENVDKNF